MKILIVGAGALGCEIIKCLILMEYKEIEIVDFDTIQISNLNRQFFYDEMDIGKFKASTVVKKLNEVSKLSLVGHCCRVESLGVGFFRGFEVVFIAVDELVTRRWINGLYASFDGNTVLIDSGIEGKIYIYRNLGLKGHCFCFFPNGNNACLECIMNLFSTTDIIPICSLSGNLSSIEDCILWAILVGGYSDQDQILSVACEKSRENGIGSIFMDDVIQILNRNIIPSSSTICSMIAGIATLKLTQQTKEIGCFTMVNMSSDCPFYMHSFYPEKNKECEICCNQNNVFKIS